MMIAAFISLYSILIHIKSLTKTQNLANQPPDEYYPIFFLLNICSICCGSIGFGAPYMPAEMELVPVTGRSGF